MNASASFMGIKVHLKWKEKLPNKKKQTNIAVSIDKARSDLRQKKYKYLS